MRHQIRSRVRSSAREPQTETSSAAAALCTNGCGFFVIVTAANMGMCSKCFRESHPAGDAAAMATKPVPPPANQVKLNVVPAATIGSSSNAAAAGAVDTSSSSAANAATQQKEGEQDQANKKPATSTANRCMTCRKKVGLTGLQCHCGGTFCGSHSHRYADAHACGFDYKAAGRERIAKQNPVVVAAKIAKI